MIPHGVDRRGIGVLAFGHLAVDLVQGSVPPLMPFLIDLRGYSYAQAGSLMLFSSLGSSLLQPLLGAFSDRISAAWLMPVGALLASIGIATAGFTPTYATTGGALFIASVGVAMYHPEAVRYASFVSRASATPGGGMSVFAVGGMSGWALAPLLVTPAVVVFGVPGVALVALVPAAAVVALAVNLTHVEAFRPRVAGAQARAARDAADDDAWGVFGVAAGAAMTRTAVQFGLQTFVPLYLWKELATSKAVGNAAGTVLLVAGAAGTLIGGRVADRIGFRPVVVRSLMVVVPLVLAITVSPAWGVFALMVPIGLAMESNFYPLVMIAQDAIPRHVGFASGVTLGLSIGAGAAMSAALGVIADHAGLTSAIRVVAAVAVVAAALAVFLPRDSQDATVS